MADLVDGVEPRLLALERKQARIDALLEDLRRRSLAVSQGIWAAWSDASGFAAAAAPSLPCPGGGTMPTTVMIHDSLYGDCPFTYDPVTRIWSGCKLVTVAPTATCPVTVSTPIFYRSPSLNSPPTTPNWQINLLFVVHPGIPLGSLCPTDGATCADRPNSVNAVSSAVVNCHGTTTWPAASFLTPIPHGTLTIDLPSGA